MATVQRLQFSTRIEAPVAKVWDRMISPTSYAEWTSAFTAGSTFEGGWDEGDRIRFLDGKGSGMVAEIAENRPLEFISIRHLGYIENGVEDTTSEKIREWAPAYENYTFTPDGNATILTVDQDVTDEYVKMFSDLWPKALQRLKEVAERK